MTSSLRNSIHRRNHKERSQLAHRSKFGILEKHGDYVKRARDYHSKQDRLTRLKQKATEKNKDEFYFSMTKERTQGGVHVKDRGNVALPTDIVKVLKTQDENYVRTMRAAGLKKIDKIKDQLMVMANLVGSHHDDDQAGLDDEELEILKESGIISPPRKHHKKPRHIVFVEDDAEAVQCTKPSNPVSKAVADEHSENIDLGWKTKTKKKSQQPSPNNNIADEMNIDTPATASSNNRRRLLKELSARLARDKQLRYAEREFEMQRLMMGKGSRKKLRGAEKVEGSDSEDGEDEDEIDARKGKRRQLVQKVDETTYKPRVYRWKLERKR
ncbi:small-subunit processome [Infundibulicybe gibba]|nr:small-subunit processome [Infundibulicybe gibba]